MNRKNDPSRVVQQLEAKCKAYAAQNAQLEARVKQLTAELSKLRLESDRRGIRRQAKDLYVSLDQAIQHKIHLRGYMHDTANRVPIPPSVLKSNNKVVVLAAAASYDAQAYFAYSKRTSKMKLRYKVASKAYRTSRDIALKSAKGVYRLAKKARR